MRYLGIDYGKKRVGVAVSDEEGRLAFPHSVLANDKNLLSALDGLIKEKNAAAIVMGESKNFQGEPNPIMPEIEEFKENLESKLKISVRYEPEFMTSAQAKRLQAENDMHDASAAAIILQSYLDKINNKIG